MGGNAIKGVARLSKAEYELVSQDVMKRLTRRFPTATFLAIKSFGDKLDFGDLDILMDMPIKVPENQNCTEGGKELEQLRAEFGLEHEEDFHPQKGSISFRYRSPLIPGKSFQVDLILEPAETIRTAQSYYDYNDLSNLLGRICRKLGFKLGSNGLSFVYRSGSHAPQDLVFSTNYEDALRLIGVSVQRYQTGFQSMEEMFEFVASSPYFNPDIFLLHNRNHKSRTRDKKRKTYHEFLKWCAKNDERLRRYPYPDKTELGGYRSVGLAKKFQEEVLFKLWPEIPERIEEIEARRQIDAEFKKVFNGHLVSEKIGIEGEPLGVLVKHILNNVADRSFKVFAIKDSPELWRKVQKEAEILGIKNEGV